jgi:hypothetical protein
MGKVSAVNLRKYEKAFKLSQEIGVTKACDQLNINYSTFYRWLKVRGPAERKPKTILRKSTQNRNNVMVMMGTPADVMKTLNGLSL